MAFESSVSSPSVLGNCGEGKGHGALNAGVCNGGFLAGKGRGLDWMAAVYAGLHPSTSPWLLAWLLPDGLDGHGAVPRQGGVIVESFVTDEVTVFRCIPC